MCNTHQPDSFDLWVEGNAERLREDAKRHRGRSVVLVKCNSLRKPLAPPYSWSSTAPMGAPVYDPGRQVLIHFEIPAQPIRMPQGPNAPNVSLRPQPPKNAFKIIERNLTP